MMSKEVIFLKSQYSFYIMATKISDTKSITGASESSDTTEKPSTSKKSTDKDGKESSKLYQFFVSALKDIYFAEDVIIEALDKMQKAATTEELKDAFEDHQLQTKKHLSRVEKVFRLLDETPEKKECEAIKGMIKECEEIIRSTDDGSMTRDAALIIAAQKVEHYEIATYGGLVQLALTMGHDTAANLLEQTLQEEEDTDYNLTEIAENYINFDAEQED